MGRIGADDSRIYALMGDEHTGLKGVNFGGWLITEKWLTPSVFSETNAEDEWTISKTAHGKQRIVLHRDTFISEEDFVWCRDNGIELIRLPVGYWLNDDYAGYVPQIKWVDLAFKWAEKYELKLLLDLHAAPGGQNGEMHSGQIGTMKWAGSKSNREKTIATLIEYAQRYGMSPALWGLELLNEPSAAIDANILDKFYNDAYVAVRQYMPQNVKILFHDSFRPRRMSGAIEQAKYGQVMMDMHIYSFTTPLKIPFILFLWVSRVRLRALIWWVQRRQPVIIGEWSSVLPQVYFDRRPQVKHTDLLRRTIQSQRHAYKHAAAHIYWNYKAEGRGMWNYRALIEDGVID